MVRNSFTLDANCSMMSGYFHFGNNHFTFPNLNVIWSVSNR